MRLRVRGFAEIAWRQQGPARYFSVVLTPVLVAALTPGLWWAPCAMGAAVGLVIDVRVEASFLRLVERAGQLDDAALSRATGRYIAGLALLTGTYVLPYSVLAFAPQPAPVIGLLLCAGAALVCATMHVMTRTMIFYTIPTVLLGLTLNAASLGVGVSSVVLAAMAGLMGVNAIVAARAGAVSFGDMTGARLDAETAAENLEKRVVERTAQLVVATNRAQAANRAKSAFLANMSHELRTPLNAVIGYSEIIEEDLANGVTRQTVDDLRKVRNAAAHLLAMINDVLDLSRVEAGKLDLRATKFELAPVLHSALDAVRLTAAKNETTLQVNVARGVGLMVADQTRLRQCVLNLLSNAAKFTQRGVVVLDASPCKISGADGVAVSVRDTGPGLAEEQLRRLFQPFVQIDATQTRAHDGAGLGLAITRRLARAMGGDVRASSTLGEGSIFTLYLPTRMSAARAGAA